MQKKKTEGKHKFLGNELNKPLLGIAFGIYLFLLIWVIGLKFNSQWLPDLGVEMRSIPLKNRGAFIPFKTFIDNGLYFELEYFLNVILYIPMGLILPFIIKKPWLSALLVFLSSLIFELAQLFTGFGGFDTTDIICNTLGGFLGLLVFYMFRKKVSDRAVNIIDFVVIIIFSPVAMYALINTIINWDLYIIR